MSRGQRVAILGGGLGSLVTAAELTDPRHGHRAEVTVYQMGWRLGGKAASGIGPWGRVEEHGLHVWFGFYQNAFALMRRVYDELGRPASLPLSSVDDAFTAMPDHTFYEQVDGAWAPWRFHFPGDGVVPGRPVAGRIPELPGVVGHVRRMVSWFRMVLATHPRLRRLAPSPQERPVKADVFADVLAGFAQRGFAHMGSTSRRGLVAGLRRLQREVVGALQGDDVRRTRILLDLTLTGLVGMVADDVAGRGFRAIDDEDLRDWLGRHGAQPATLDTAVVRTLYDIFFGYEGGDWDRPRVAAGAALRGLMRMLFGYHGAVVWKMNAGMGDAIVAPLYEVLRRRGVRFRFFHEVTSLRLDASGERVAEVHVDEQVALRVADYQPLQVVGDLPCWPAAPHRSQLQDPSVLDERDLERPRSGPPVARKVLRHGVDFDRVVLGIPVGALPSICRELIEARPAWADMVTHLGTVRTQALQLWFSRPLSALSPHPSGMVASFEQPFSSWSDFTQVLEHEGWPAPAPRGLAYACGVLADDADPDGIDDTVQQWLTDHGDTLWPSDRQGFDWGHLHDPQGRAGPARLAAQYWRTNTSGSERYVQSLPGTTRYRLAPGASGFTNLVLAGDWTDNGYNLGCVEATVMSGMLASRALCGHPRVIVGEE